MHHQDLKGKKIGLALGGGAVLGAAHIGVLKALEELEVEIAYLSGTSIGSLVASLYAFGIDVETVKGLAIDMSWTDISAFSLSKFGLLSNVKIKSYIEKHIGKRRIEESPIPMAFIAADIATGKKVVLDSGDVATAVMASTCIPGIFKPVKIDNQLLVDGGIVENVPVSPLQAFGAERIIAVDLNAEYHHKTPTNVIDVILNSFHFALVTASDVQTQKADLIISPDLSGFSKINANQTSAIIERGYEATMRTLC